MHAQNLLVYNCSDREAIEAIREGFPKLHVVSSFTFIIESVNSVNTGTLVIPSKQEEILRILDLGKDAVMSEEMHESYLIREK